MNSILAFWFAYVVTRPLGASFADWLAVSPARGGLGIGTGLVSFVLAATIAALVAWLTMTREDTPGYLAEARSIEAPADGLGGAAPQ
jgi:uncharacterized membrane-anchored protein